MRIVIAGGGTGGHVIPALAVARELRDRYSAEVLFVGTARGIENRLVPAAGFRLELVEVGALNRVSLGTRLKTLIRLPAAVLQSRRILREFASDAVLGVGGYASGPAMMAAVLARIPTIAFEPNVVPGFANRIVARWVSAAAVHFEETRRYFRHSEITGVPVRPEFFQVGAPLAGEPPTLLVFGGSQGAQAINRAMMAAAPLLRERLPGLRAIHQTGERDYAEVNEAYTKAEVTAEVSPFIDDMPGAFARAHLLVCRAGASTVAEVAAAGKPAIFIPLPTAADNHQLRNAEALARRNAAKLLPQAELTAERLADMIASLLRDPERLAAMGTAAKALSHPQAAARIAEMIAVAGKQA